MRGTSRYFFWPAYVDLFSGFAFLLLGAVVLLDPARKATAGNGGGIETLTDAQAVAKLLYSRIEQQRFPGLPDVQFQNPTPEDVTVTFRVEFARDSDRISAEDREKVVRVGQGVCEAVEAVTSDPEIARRGLTQEDVRRRLQIVVEGHTDSTVPRNLPKRDQSKWNWDLSAKRASAVLFELEGDGVGLSNESYNIVAWGRADSDPVCRDDGTEDCYRQNRRTTIRLKYDYSQATGPGR